MSWDVFISYSREDDSVTDRIEAHLLQAGLQCYRDKHSITDAAIWRAEIARAIRDSFAVLAIVSEVSSNSEFVSTELALAQDFRKEIVPVLLTHEIRNDELRFVLGRRQWIFAEGDLTGRLPAIEQAVWQAVERGRNPQVFAAIATVQKKSNFHHEADLGSNSLGLDVNDFDAGTRRLAGSSFQMTAYEGKYIGSVMHKCPRLADFEMRLRVEKLSGLDSGWFGLEFGELWPGGYLQALLSGNGSVRIAKTGGKDGEWRNLIERENAPQLRHGNAENEFCVVRSDNIIYVLVNERFALSYEESDFPLTKFGLVAGPGVSIVYRQIKIKGWAVDQTFEEVVNAYQELDISRARKLTQQIQDRVPNYRHPAISNSLEQIKDEPMPDRSAGILIVIGKGMLAQLHDGTEAHRLREEIIRRSKSPFETAFFVTDMGMLENERFHVCPWISIGGPETNMWTRRFTSDFPNGTIGDGEVFVQERIGQGDRRLLLWGNTRGNTVRALEFFLTRGGIDQFLRLIWQHA